MTISFLIVVKKYEKPTITKVVLNPSQAVLSVCSTFPIPTLSGGGGSTCNSQSTKCKKQATGGNSGGRC